MAEPVLQTLALTLEPDVGIATLLLHRPAAANALTMPMVEELVAAFDFLETQPSVRAVVLSGSGTRFCAGIDLRTLAELLASARGPCACEGRRSGR